jgi:tetratricopeptide (TPR) repeat protein
MGIDEQGSFETELQGLDAIEADRQRRARTYSLLAFAGLVAALLLTAGIVAWRWPVFARLPWVVSATDFLFHARLPQAPQDRFSVAIAHLDGDTANRRAESMLRNELAALGDIAVLPIDRGIFADEHATTRAHKLVGSVGADALVWGTVDAGTRTVRLHWTPNARLAATRGTSMLASVADSTPLPPLSAEDLLAVFNLLVSVREAEFPPGPDSPEVTALLDAPIQAVRQRLQDSAHPLDSEANAAVQALLAEALAVSADRSGNDTALQESAALYQALPDATLHSAAPAEWARARNNLGFALGRLGEYAADTQTLDAAIAALRDALQERTAEKTPLDWAATQNLLGLALTARGQRDADAQNLDAAVVAFRSALLQWTPDGTPAQWAATQNNLGIALALLHERKPGAGKLHEAATAFQSALKVWTLDHDPLSWSLAQSRLGLALDKLGEHDDAQQALNEAVSELRAALQDRSLDAVPAKKAMLQYNLGLTLAALGEHDSGTTRLEAAANSFRAALQGWTRETAPYAWASTQNQLGLVLISVATHNGLAGHYDEAIAAFRAALQEWSHDRVPYRWAAVQNNLGFALMASSAQTPAADRSAAALAAFRAALQEWTRDNALDEWATAQNNLGLVLEQLGQFETGTRYLSQAVSAYSTAKSALRPSDDPFLFSRIAGNYDRSRSELERRRTLAAQVSVR